MVLDLIVKCAFLFFSVWPFGRKTFFTQWCVCVCTELFHGDSVGSNPIKRKNRDFGPNFFPSSFFCHGFCVCVLEFQSQFLGQKDISTTTGNGYMQKDKDWWKTKAAIERALQRVLLSIYHCTTTSKNGNREGGKNSPLGNGVLASIWFTGRRERVIKMCVC